MKENDNFIGFKKKTIVAQLDGLPLEHLDNMLKEYGQRTYPAILRIILMEHKRLMEKERNKIVLHK